MCSGRPTVCGAYASAEAVFIGSVKRVEAPRANTDNGPGGAIAGQIAHIQVEKVFKGISEVEVIFSSGGSSCDHVYKEGQRWLFYAYQDKTSRTWSIGACGRSRSIEDAADDLLFLQALPNSMQRTRISGVVEHHENDAQKSFSRVDNIAGAKVKLTSGQKTYEVVTDANGVYEIYDLPPGQYTIEPDLPPNLKLRFPIYNGEADYTDRARTRVILREGSCAGADFILSTNVKIGGRVIGADGHALPNVCLSLQPKDKPVRDNWIFACTDKQGHYELKNVPPGEYIIVVNYDGKISSDEPFPRAYYPGVFERERAIVLSVPNANKMDNCDINIPSQEARRLIQGVLQYSDGDPAAGEFVEFKADSVKEGYDGKVHTKTDAQGRFSFNVLQGLKGRIYGFMYTYSGEYKNCPQLEKLIQAKASRAPSIETGPIELEVTDDVQDLKLTFAFPHCAKAKRE